jgi:hypothetical protein
MSARSLIGCGVRRRAIVLVRMASVEGAMGVEREAKTVSGSLWACSNSERKRKKRRKRKRKAIS